MAGAMEDVPLDPESEHKPQRSSITDQVTDGEREDTSEGDSLEEEETGRPERWAPLGADAPTPSPNRMEVAIA